MKVVCAWCQRMGTETVLREKEPQNDVVSHGICDDHVLQVLAEARRSEVLAGTRKTSESYAELQAS